MKLTLNIEQVGDYFYTKLIEDLVNYADCIVTKDGEDVIVQMEGDIVACSCVVAICDRFRFSKDVSIPKLEGSYEKNRKKTSAKPENCNS